MKKRDLARLLKQMLAAIYSQESELNEVFIYLVKQKNQLDELIVRLKELKRLQLKGEDKNV